MHFTVVHHENKRHTVDRNTLNCLIIIARWLSFLGFCHALRTLITCATINFSAQHDTAFITLNCLFRFCHALRTLITCTTIKFLQNLPRGTIIRAVLLLSSEEYTHSYIIDRLSE